MWYKKTTLFAQEKVKTAVTAATGHEPVAVSVAWDYGDCKKTIETILEQEPCRSAELLPCSFFGADLCTEISKWKC